MEQKISLLEHLHKLYWTFNDRRPDLGQAFMEHVYLSATAMLFALIIAIPLALLLTRNKKYAEHIIGVTAVFQTIPSLALLGFMLPLLGIGSKPAIVALVIYALLPIVRNTYTGIIEVDSTIKQAGRGMGMTDWQILMKIELPLAIPTIMAGVRMATVLTIGITTIAAFIGAGGLGDIIFRGISMNNNYLIIVGSIAAAGFAITVDVVLRKLEKILTAKGVR